MSKKIKTNLRRRNVGLKKKSNLRTRQTERIRQINDALSKKDILELRRLATTGPGLVNDGLRRLCWSLLLHYGSDEPHHKNEEHKDERQVLLDVERSFVYFPKGLSHAQRKQKQSELNDVIVGILRRHPKLSYYQGFHDVCSVLLLVLGKKDAIKAGENIAMFLLRDAMLNSLDPILRQLDLLNILIRLEDSEIANFLEKSNTLPYFCLSWVITWCSHDIRDLSKIVRLFDFFIASDPLIVIYLSAKVITGRRKELLALECDDEMVHIFLSKFPQHIDIDELISKTIQLYKRYPPRKLQKDSNEELDETSCVNLYKKHWLRFKVDEPIDYSVVDEILSMPPSPRKPKRSSEKSNPFSKLNKKQTTALVVLSASVSTAAVILIVSIWLMKSFPEGKLWSFR